jgi:hypothetical protein
MSSKFLGNTSNIDSLAQETTLEEINDKLTDLDVTVINTPLPVSGSFSGPVTIGDVILPMGGQTDNLGVSGSVSVSNLANPHPVSGTIAVSNLANPHPVSGTIAVSNLANPHPISGTVAVSSGTVTVSNLANPHPISGSVTVSNTVNTNDTDYKQVGQAIGSAQGPVILAEDATNSAVPLRVTGGNNSLRVDISGTSIGNQQINLNQVQGQDILTGNGPSFEVARAVQRVAICSDNNDVPIKNGIAGDINVNLNAQTSDITTTTKITDVVKDKKTLYQEDNLNVNASNWGTIVNSNWSPFATDRFKSFQAINLSEGDAALYFETASGGYGWARTVNKYQLKPSTISEITFSCILNCGNYGGGNVLDYTRIGLYSDDQSSQSTFPKTSIFLDYTDDASPSNQWRLVIYYNLGGNEKVTSVNFLTLPNAGIITTFKMVLYNYKKPIIYLYQLQDNDTGLWTYCTSLRLNSNRLFRNSFHFGSIISTSNANIAQAILLDFNIKTDAPEKIEYDELPVLRAYCSPLVSIVTANVKYAVLGVRMNPSNTIQTTIWLRSAIFDIDIGGKEVCVALYKNPTLSAPHTWSVTQDRVQFSTVIGTITVSSGFATAVRFGNSTSGSGNRTNVIDLPKKTIGLFEPGDEIYIVCEVLNTNNCDFHVAFNLEY